MDINVLRIVVTVLGFVCFLGICVWAYSKHAKQGFDEAAQLALSDDDLPVEQDRSKKEGKTNG